MEQDKGTEVEAVAGRGGEAGPLGGVGVVRVGWTAEGGWLRHGFSTRVGGVSTVYGGVRSDGLLGGSLNLGWTKEDDAARVRENRRALVDAAGGRGARLVTVRQIHSSVVVVVRAGDGPLEGEDGRAVMEGDGLMTDVPGLLLGIQTADCVPVLVADRRRRVVAGFHAGWRGTLGRIVERGVERMRMEYGTRAEDLIAAVGPSIGRCCYSVGEEVRSEFEAAFGYGRALISEVVDSDGRRRTHLDLAEANRRQLLDAGVNREAITVVGECTACARDGDGGRRYFSHRAEHGATGRMMSVIGIAVD